MWAALTGSGKKTPTPDLGTDSDEEPTQAKVCRVSIGPKDTGEKVLHAVNDDANPLFFESEDFVARVCVRIKDFKGISPDGVARPSTPYFGTRKRIFSIQVQGRFTKPILADDLMFGGVFERKVSPPMGTWLAFKAANVIDPALRYDLYAAQPWILSPALCRSETLRAAVSDTDSLLTRPFPYALLRIAYAIHTVNVVPAQHTWKEINDRRSRGEKLTADDLLGKWEWGGEKELTEDSSRLFPESIPVPFDTTSVAERRDFLGDEETRQAITLQPDLIYSFDIFGPFFSFQTQTAELGITLSVTSALNDQPIRLVFQSRQRQTFCCIQFELVDPPPLPDRPKSPKKP
ncbi:hypothetical protein DFJ74DRAFT_601346 [Hyaloraphidium curvatum]|nr:hypothetical protein DFJ74DRAFT_601346 [Hyaloraphidium curvatum]